MINVCKSLLVVLLLAVVQPAWSQFGKWSFNSNKLPVYQYTGSLPFTTVDDEGKDSNLPEDPYFLLGNYRMSLVTHASGIYQFMSGQRAWARLNFNDEQINYGSNEAYIVLKDGGRSRRIDLAGLTSSGADNAITKRYFGVGFARYEYNFGNGINCNRVISVKPSEKINSGNPSFLITVELKNNGKKKQELAYTESMLVNFVTMNLQLIPKNNRPLLYPNTMTVNESEKWAMAEVNPVANTFLLLPEKNQSYMYDVAPPTVFMHLAGAERKAVSTIGAANDKLTSTVGITLRPGESVTFNVVIGVFDKERFTTIPKQVNDLLAGANSNAFDGGLFAQQWKDKLPDFSDETNEVMRRELLWNTHFIESSAKYSEYYDETSITQGSVYAYHFGDNIAARDLLQASLPACYTNPELAKSCLRYVMKHTRHDGEIPRGNVGFAYVPPTIYKESDQQLYMFLAVSEYLQITKDYAFLNEVLMHSDVADSQGETVLNILKRHFIYLRDEIGTGRNGLIRLLNSDWADSFLHAYSPNRYGGAESHLNSAMASAVIPPLIQVLKESGNNEATTFIDALETYHQKIEKAYLTDLGNRKFSARAYLSRDLRFGVDNVCIEPQSYMLQISSLPVSRKKEMYAYIKEKLITPEKIGARNREEPLWGSAAAGEDGGIWFSLQYPLLLGVATFDKEEAWSLLHRFSFDNYAKNYPQYWVGHWTAADEVNSTMYREGLYSFWLGGVSNLRNAFQGYCSHPHTWPVFCYYKLKAL